MTPEEFLPRILAISRWKRLGYGQLQCSSCGAIAYEDFELEHRIYKREPCSLNCPYWQAEEWLDKNA